jgi:large subunit ribosomal protein LP0
MAAKAKKTAYFAKLTQLLEEYNKILIVEATNVGSNQMQVIRKTLRGNSVVLMGKNTMIRKAMRHHLAKNPRLEGLLDFVRGNIGFIFTRGDLSDVKAKVTALKVDAPARVGSIAPANVTVPAGPTGLEPTQTSFLQALNIPSKINKGQVEIVNDFLLIKTGDRIGQSEAALLTKLNIRPFKYGLHVKMVYDDGSIYDPVVLDLTEKEILEKFMNGVRNVTALGLGLSFPSSLSVPHLMLNGYRNVLALGLGADYSFPRLEKLKSAAASAPAPSAPAPAGKDAGKDAGKKDTGKAPEPVKAPEPEPEEEELGLSLFD